MVVAKHITSYNWFIRIDGPHEHLRNKLSDVSGWIDYNGMCWALHNGVNNKENPHVHICLKLSSCIQKQSLDTRIKKLFGVKGAEYSSVVWDLKDEALQYLFHEDEECEWFNGLQLDPDRISTLKLNCKIVKDAVEKAKEKASHRVVDKILDLIAKSGNKWSAYDIGFEIQKMVWRKESYDPGNFMLERYIYEILAKQCQSEQDLDAMWNDRCRQLKCFN